MELFVLKSPDLVDDRILVIRTRMQGNVFFLQPRIVGSIEKAVDFVHHTTEGMPANLTLLTIAIKFR
jgi:hypothetical protein